VIVVASSGAPAEQVWKVLTHLDSAPGGHADGGDCTALLSKCLMLW
jgi:hypothetical protein